MWINVAVMHTGAHCQPNHIPLLPPLYCKHSMGGKETPTEAWNSSVENGGLGLKEREAAYRVGDYMERLDMKERAASSSGEGWGYLTLSLAKGERSSIKRARIDLLDLMQREAAQFGRIGIPVYNPESRSINWGGGRGYLI